MRERLDERQFDSSADDVDLRIRILRMSWSLQDCKTDLSSVVEKAMTEGVQIVTSHGERTAVVLAADDYDRLISTRPSIVDHLLAGPKWDDDLADDINDRAQIRRHAPDV